MYNTQVMLDGISMNRATAVNYAVLQFYIDQGMYDVSSKQALIDYTDDQYLKKAFAAYKGTDVRYTTNAFKLDEWITD